MKLQIAAPNKRVAGLMRPIAPTAVKLLKSSATSLPTSRCGETINYMRHNRHWTHKLHTDYKREVVVLASVHIRKSPTAVQECNSVIKRLPLLRVKRNQTKQLKLLRYNLIVSFSRDIVYRTLKASIRIDTASSHFTM